MLKKIIYCNRELTSLFVNIFNNMFGEINNCEDYFYSLINNKFTSKTILELGGTNRPLFKSLKKIIILV